MSECLLKLCGHRAADGSKCKAPALRQSDYCRHHTRVHRPAVIFPAYIYEAQTVPQLQAALHRTMQNIFDGTYTTKYFGQVLHEISKQIQQVAKMNGRGR
jgi:hypothetical protein